MRTKKRNLLSSSKNEDDRVHKRSKDNENVGEANEAQQMINDMELDDNSTEYLSNDEIDQQSKQEKKNEDDKMSEDSQQVAYFSFSFLFFENFKDT